MVSLLSSHHILIFPFLFLLLPSLLLVDVIPPGDSVVNFTDAEDLISDAELM